MFANIDFAMEILNLSLKALTYLITIILLVRLHFTQRSNLSTEEQQQISTAKAVCIQSTLMMIFNCVAYVLNLLVHNPIVDNCEDYDVALQKQTDSAKDRYTQLIAEVLEDVCGGGYYFYFAVLFIPSFRNDLMQSLCVKRHRKVTCEKTTTTS